MRKIIQKRVWEKDRQTRYQKSMQKGSLTIWAREKQINPNEREIVCVCVCVDVSVDVSVYVCVWVFHFLNHEKTHSLTPSNVNLKSVYWFNGHEKKKISFWVCVRLLCVCVRVCVSEREIVGARDSDRKQLEEATADQSLVLWQREIIFAVVDVASCCCCCYGVWF